VKGVECLGACGYAPMLQLGDYFHEFLTPAKMDALIEDCKSGKVELISKV
jgi:NADH-quinone oxidoreductase subunit E